MQILGGDLAGVIESADADSKVEACDVAATFSGISLDNLLTC